MANPIGDFMGAWLNTTYQYLRETGGPTYPGPATVGPNVMPTGPYTEVADLKEDWIDFPAVGGTPLPFNPGSMGLPAIGSNQNDAVVEEAKQASTPTVFSDGFAKLYGGLINACISDQKHRHCNPDANGACQEFAQTGAVTRMILNPVQKSLLGMKIPPSQENNKSDEVRKAENEASLTGQISRGASDAWSGFASFLASGGIKKNTSARVEPMENPQAINFQGLGEKIADFTPELPGIPGMPQMNAGTITMLAGGAVLLMLVILVIK